MVRRMGDPDFKASQIAHQMDAHIAPINKFVDELQSRDGRGWLPKVAPMHGGVDAQVLSVLSDPGKATQGDEGSGFLCVENRDPTAANQCRLFEAHGISPRSVLPWNAYPWFIDRPPNAEQKKAGAEVLCELIDIARSVRVILLQGEQAIDVWKRVLKLRPTLVADRQLVVAESIHPSPNALRTPDRSERQARLDRQRLAFEKVAQTLLIQPV